MNSKDSNKSLDGTSYLKIKVLLLVAILMFTGISIVQYLHFTEILDQFQVKINLQESQIEELKKLLEISNKQKQKKIDLAKVYLFLKVFAVVTLTLGGGLVIYKLMPGVLITPFINDVTNMLSGLNENLKIKFGMGEIEVIEPLTNGMNTVIIFSNRIAKVFIEIEPGRLVSLDDFLWNMYSRLERPKLETESTHPDLGFAIENAPTSADILEITTSLLF